ncbi:hypothetical protein PR048_007418 [Dryococelus australis]|uniref:DNA-directed DNA polymerase n=1 Tax=Dryococelus australis TaxID=614101 RepID=A0ABQ9HV40_9NEOP|nr:hypothetical protein PR048_007418 [Dryococelus australis]
MLHETMPNHEPISFCYYVKYEHGYYKPPVTYERSDASTVFVKMLMEEAKSIATHCHICEKPLNGDSVGDHNHLTAKFRGAAHRDCNLSYRNPCFVPVFIHNLSGYDTHLFIRDLGIDENKIDLIPNNEEKNIYFAKHVCEIVSINSLATFPEANSDKRVSIFPMNFLTLLQEKVFTHMTTWVVLKNLETSLPSKDAFYNKLNECSVTDEDYEFARKVWEKFNIKSLREYSELYNKSDVLILSDIMENFRDLCLKTYKLDPAWYFTAPGLAWDAMLKHTKIEPELLTDYDMILMIEKGVRGGISQCCKRNAKANNKYMNAYDSTKEIFYLTYLDANNLYGWAMSQYLPYGGFKWGNTYIYATKIEEVDLEYPHELHDLHKYLPLAPENKITEVYLMYNFHYNILKSKYGENIELCYQDTDSYIYYIKTPDFYSDMKEMVDHFDTSDYKKDNPYGIPLVNKKIIDKMKDECNGKIMEEFIGLKSKMYAINVEGGVKKRAKV